MLDLMLRVLLGEWLLSLMSGLLGAWWRIRSLVHLLLGLVALPIAAVVFGRIGGGAIWMKVLMRMLLLGLVEVFVLFLVLCSLFKGLSSGVLFLLSKLMMGSILGLTILLFGMLAASWMARLLLVLLSWLKDGDLILLKERMLRLRELDTVLISKVKGHADEALSRAGRARDLDRLGNNGVDEAADFGRGEGASVDN